MYFLLGFLLAFLHLLKTCKKLSSLFWLLSIALRTSQVLCDPPRCLTWKVNLEGNVTTKSVFYVACDEEDLFSFLLFHFRKRRSDWLCFARLNSPSFKPSQRRKWEERGGNGCRKPSTMDEEDRGQLLKFKELCLRHDGRSSASGQCLL